MIASLGCPQDIDTRRLSLRCLSPRAIQAGIAGDLRTAEECLGARVPTDLAEDPAVLRYAQAQAAADADYFPWLARAIILRDSTEMIGHIRFHTRPDPEYLLSYARGAIEVGYVVFVAYRKQGYSYEALLGGISRAEECYSIKHFVASISPRNLPSIN